MNKAWKKFIIVVSVLVSVMIVCVSVNFAIDSITGSILPQTNAGTQQNGVINNSQNSGTMQQGTSGGDSQPVVTPDGGDSVQQQTPSDAGQQGGNTQTPVQNNNAENPLNYNKSQLISYYNSCLKKSYSQKMSATKTEQVDVEVSGISIGGGSTAGINVDKMAQSIIANNTKKNGVVQAKSFVNGKATDDGSAVEKFVLPTNLYDAAVKSINIKQNGQGYQIVIVLNEESCAHNGTAKYNASCAWPLDVGVIDFGQAVTIKKCTFTYPGTKLTAMIDGQGRVYAVKTEMPLTVANAEAEALMFTIKVGSISGKWTCINELKF